MKEKKVILFGGTTEGRKLAEYLAVQKVKTHVCVATEYGESLLPAKEGMTVSHDRMDRIEMERLMTDYNPDVVIDATHPYAAEVTENIQEACKKCKLPYLRAQRVCDEIKDCIYVESIKEAVSFLEQTKGNILAVTGSKEIQEFTALKDYKERVFARVLSLTEVVEKCEALGIRGRHLICMQGPFSVEMNLAILREYGISYMVTKASGIAGGFPEKCEAARRAGVKLVVIGRPKEENGYSVSEIFRILEQELALEACVKEEKKQRQKVFLVGIGAGAEDNFTEKAKKVCAEAELIIGAKRMVETVKTEGRAQFVSYKAEEIAEYVCAHRQYQKIAVVLSGDVGFYSGAEKLKSLLKEIPQVDTELIPGVSSIVYFAARLGVSWQDAALISMHGKEQPVISLIRDHKKVFLLSGSAEGIRSLGRKMIAYGYKDLIVRLGSDLSYEGEVIRTYTGETLADYEGSGLAVLYIENEEVKSRTVSGGISDEAFLRGKVPMTKEEVRSVSLSKLRLKKDSLVFDIGAGTGSVAVEAAQYVKDGQVYAIEVREEGVRLIQENSYRFGTDNLTVIQGEAPGVLEELPVPDRVFIGGSKGNLKEIIRKVTGKNAEVRIVINAISLETLTEALDIMKSLKKKEGYQVAEEEIVQISAARSKTAGNYHMMTGQNPVFIISFTSIYTGETL